MNDSFTEKFRWSRKPQHVRQELSLLQQLYPNSRADVADVILDRRGADYVVKHSGGISYVDFKRRQTGCSRHWKRKDTPEIPVEIWNDTRRRVPGWTFKRLAVTNDVIFIFDESDSETAYVVDFRELQSAARENIQRWKSLYGVRLISSHDGGSCWTAETIFVPITELTAAGVHVTTIPARDPKQNSLPN